MTRLEDEDREGSVPPVDHGLLNKWTERKDEFLLNNSVEN
jgi:hypothetical protein